MSQERFTITSPAYGRDGSSTQGKTNGSGEDHVGATFLNDPYQLIAQLTFLIQMLMVPLLLNFMNMLLLQEL